MGAVMVLTGIWPFHADDIKFYIYQEKLLGEIMKSYPFFSVIIFLLAVFLWQCAPDYSESLSREMAAEIAMLPADPAAIGYLNIESIKQSEFFSLVEENLEKNPFYSDDYQEFMDATGLDIREDIDEVYFTFNKKDTDDDPELFAVIRGNFQPERIMDYIMEEEGQSLREKTLGEHTIYLIEDGEFAICFADNQRLLAGKQNAVESWLRQKDGDQRTKMSESLNRSIQAVKYKQQGWMVMDTHRFVNKMMDEFNHRNPDTFEGLKSLNQMNFSVYFDEYMKFNALGQFTDAEKAELFRDALKGFIATAKLSMSEDRKAIDVLNKIEVNANKSEVVIQFRMSRDDIDRLRQKREELAHRW